jgi:protein-tyrosine phosphatase
MMTRVLEKMWVGNSEFTDEDLDRRGIDHVLNVGGVNITTTKLYTHLHLNDDNTNSPSQFSTILAVLDDSMKKGFTTLVCCRAGQSRSVAVVILWLERMGMNRYGAYDYVKRLHPAAQVNEALWRSL